MKRKNVVIMGAAGRDFHNFNMYFRNNDEYNVVAFTATQIPDIEGRTYPVELAGEKYPCGIPIMSESKLKEIIAKDKIDEVIFSYSDVPHKYVMSRASEVLASGADFKLLGPNNTMLQSSKPVISICAVRTGCGKSQTTRRVAEILKKMNKRVAVIRHPMPYGNLVEQVWQRYEKISDLDRYKCTIEEREEYEPHINNGNIVYAGVDYGVILKKAESESDCILWDGGNNDLPFIKSNLEIVVTDPLRYGHEDSYHPGETNLLRADIVVINKIDSANRDEIYSMREKIFMKNPRCKVVEAASPIYAKESGEILGKRVVVIEDGPTLTHGEMPYGAGFVAAKKFGASEIIDPRPFAVGSIKKAYKKYPHMGPILPALGYGSDQIKELSETLNKCKCELAIIATPIDLGKLLEISTKSVRVTYDLEEIGKPKLDDLILPDFFKRG